MPELCTQAIELRAQGIAAGSQGCGTSRAKLPHVARGVRLLWAQGYGGGSQAVYGRAQASAVSAARLPSLVCKAPEPCAQSAAGQCRDSAALRALPEATASTPKRGPVPRRRGSAPAPSRRQYRYG